MRNDYSKNDGSLGLFVAMVWQQTGRLFHFPHVEDDALKIGGEGGSADKEGIVQPTVFAVGRCLKLRGCTKVERGIAVGILAVGDDATVAHMDKDTVVRLDAVDGLQFGTTVGTGQLIVGPATENGSLDVRSLERTTRDGDDGTSSMLRVVDGKSTSKRHFQLQGKLQPRCFLGYFGLCADIQGDECQQHDEKIYLFHFTNTFLPLTM